MRKYLSLLFIVLTVVVHAQDNTLLHPGRIIFYNTENLFDTIDDPSTKDEEFLPQSKNKWDTKKYQTKLDHIAYALAAMLDTIQPFVIGLSEIENHKVLEDLVAQPALKKFHFGIIQHDSPDERGIDVAILYNPDVVKVAFDETLNIYFPFDSEDKTRDILYIKAYINEGEPLWIFVNHWPSRWGGAEASEPKRLYVAKVLKDKIENVYLGEHFAKVIVMGDFNDNPDNASLLSLTAEKKSGVEPMIDLMKPMEKKNLFTLRYKGENDIFDQFVVSKNLLEATNPYFISSAEAHIFSAPFLMFNHPKYGLIPNRTYSNGHWVHGYSDHLPVYLDINFHK